jgi:biopolymer transport protein ExbB/TolQ
MGGTSEREFMEKLRKMHERFSKRTKDIRKEVAKIERIKVDALQKIEEMRRSADHEMSKIERKVQKSKDLAPESKQRLNSEMTVLKHEIEDDYAQLRTQIAETIAPILA